MHKKAKKTKKKEEKAEISSSSKYGEETQTDCSEA